MVWAVGDPGVPAWMNSVDTDLAALEAADTAEAAARVAGDAATAATAAAALAAGLALVPSLEELTWCWSPTLTLTTTVSWPVFGPVPFALRATTCSIATWNSTVTANDTNYWTITLRRVRANVTADIATITTRATAGVAGQPFGSITSRTGRNFDGATFDASNQVFQKDDIMSVAFIPTGSPTSLSGIIMTGRYEPT